jgi:hypothetical protein
MALNKHNVSCGDGYLLRGWGLVWPTNTMLFIEYWCVSATTLDVNLMPAAGKQECTVHNSTSNSDGGGMVVFLDRHNVQCPTGKALRGWVLRTSNPTGPIPNEMMIEFTCCGPRKS